MKIPYFTVAAMLSSTGLVAPAAAQSSRQNITVSAEVEDFNRDLGSRRSATLEYRLESDTTTLTFTSTAGERRSVTTKDRSVGAGATVYNNWSKAVSTRTQVFVSENEPVFARYDLSQDATVRLVKGTNLTIGGRYARFFGKEDVYFASAGVRQYFRGGSVAYRVSVVEPDGRDAYLAHLVNLVINDPRGDGRTRLWLSAGETSYDRPQVGSFFEGKDYAAVLQRSQPIGGPLALVVTGGLASYARPGRNVTGTTLGIGLSSRLGNPAPEQAR